MLVAVIALQIYFTHLLIAIASMYVSLNADVHSDRVALSTHKLLWHLTWLSEWHWWGSRCVQSVQETCDCSDCMRTARSAGFAVRYKSPDESISMLLVSRPSLCIERQQPYLKGA